MKLLLEKIVSEGIANGDLQSELSAEETAEYYLLLARGIIYDWCLHDGEYELVGKMSKYIQLLNRLFTTK